MRPANWKIWATRTIDDLPHGGTDAVGVAHVATPTRSRRRVTGAVLATALITGACGPTAPVESAVDSPPPAADPVADQEEMAQAAPIGGVYTGNAFLNGSRLQATIAFPAGGGPAAYLLVAPPDGPVAEQLVNDTGGRVTVQGTQVRFEAGGYTDHGNCLIDEIRLEFDATDPEVLELGKGSGSGACGGEAFSVDMTGWRLKRTAETVDPSEHARFAPDRAQINLVRQPDERMPPLTDVDAAFNVVDDKGVIGGTVELRGSEAQALHGNLFSEQPIEVTGTRTGNRVTLQLADFADVEKCTYADTVLTLETADGVRWDLVESQGSRTCKGQVHATPITQVSATG